MTSLSKESKEKIDHYVSKGYLSDDVYTPLFKATTKQGIIEALRSVLSVNEVTYSRMWTFIADNVCSDVNNVLDGGEHVLFRSIMRKQGVMIRNSIAGTTMTQYMTRRSIEKLEEREMIDVMILDSNEKVIMVHPKFMHDVFGDDTHE